MCVCVCVLLDDVRDYNTSDNVSTAMETAPDIQQKMWRFSKNLFVHVIWQCKAFASNAIFKFSSILLMQTKRSISITTVWFNYREYNWPFFLSLLQFHEVNINSFSVFDDNETLKLVVDGVATFFAAGIVF